MSDLSGLNPTPHAIAVYASRPLSPGVTQHSLPSGRCPLLGPVFHRLDRTSLPGALIRSPRRRARAGSGGTSKPSAFAVLRLMTSSNLFGFWTGRSAGLGAFEDAIDVPCRLAELFGVIVAIGDQIT